MRSAPYNFEVMFDPGKQNCLADALSRFITNSREPVSYLSSAPLFFTPVLEPYKTAAGRPILQCDSHNIGNADNPNHRTRSLYYIVKKEILRRKVTRDGKPYPLLVVPRTIWPKILVHHLLMTPWLVATWELL